ncbi:DNA-binding transcriptional regulator, GntR family [Nocardioides alpinus]|uniref:DNA-binding transcriptional regulator, GntR family n=1 Tax=Nocardioides alpinus TaxID=748909 RepID=A0A1I0XUA1_9ACTN|nr:GntR family transcriptional regulator [Nocardioides alpinus]PKH42850.1 GntR family transcriptional regulator [Nocardioides alpinus]SFB04582.1 DNA-binding transcriptional regulator, GntR family [Nocardioides alpinus]
MTTTSWLDGLRAERPGLGRASTSGRVADVLRARITEGHLRPGTRLSEEDIGAALGVSRNTLREAFRLLGHERLLVHEFNRGVFVRELTVDDVRDLYQLRRILECGAVRRAAERRRAGSSDDRWAELLAPVREAVEEGEAAAAREQWVEVGTANMHFHQAVAALAQSPRVSEAMGHLLAELRLVFHVMDAPQAFHLAYLPENRTILELLAAGDLDAAESVMAAYLDAAEAQLIGAFAAARES